MPLSARSTTTIPTALRANPEGEADLVLHEDHADALTGLAQRGGVGDQHHVGGYPVQVGAGRVHAGQLAHALKDFVPDAVVAVDTHQREPGHTERVAAGRGRK
ncbi:hypothetical protein AB0K86_17775 [Streptomyces clavifer]|uniref:hypothetical protein n=1 Tax=Streptomyces clavifer TaxID=68188 RepID=UPI0034186A92